MIRLINGSIILPLMISLAGCVTTLDQRKVESKWGVQESPAKSKQDSKEESRLSVSSAISNKPNNEGVPGRKRVNLGEAIRYDLYASEGNVFVVSIYGEVPHLPRWLRLQGITNNENMVQPTDLNSDYKGNKKRCDYRRADECLRYLFGDREFHKINKKQYYANSSDAYDIVISFPGTRVDLKARHHGTSIDFSFVNYSHLVPAWEAAYRSAFATKSPEALDAYIVKYPNSHRISDATKELFDLQFDVKLIRSVDSDNRPVTARALTQSLAGACRDMERHISITPRGKPLRAYDASITFVLYRYYRPYSLETKGDPLRISRRYHLSEKNKFSVSDVIKYECVLTSGRFHSLMGSFIGLVGNVFLGTDKNIAAPTTTLNETRFSYEVESLK